jgi:nucleoside-diphosphate-sugar epimerase
MQNIVITGASGWLGRATIRAFVKEFGTPILDQISAFGASHKIITLHGIGEIQIRPLSDLLFLQNCDFLFHYAFLTRDLLDKSEVDVYRESNDLIRKIVSSFILLTKPEALIFCSSGAVSQRTKKQEQDFSYGVYAEMKAKEQVDLINMANSCGTRTIMCTLFSATGIDMVDPSKYAIGSLVQQALYGKEIVIESNGMVLRKYVDTEDLMQLLIKLAQEKPDIEFESGGDIVELSELATLVDSIVGNQLKVVRTRFDANSPIDDYFSRSNFMAEMFHHYGIKAKSLESQVANVIESVKISNKRIH